MFELKDILVSFFFPSLILLQLSTVKDDANKLNGVRRKQMELGTVTDNHQQQPTTNETK